PDFLGPVVDFLGIAQHPLPTVFSFGPWAGAGYKWGACPWTVGGPTLIEQGGELYQALLPPGIPPAMLFPVGLAAILAAPAGAFPRNDMMQLTAGSGAMTGAPVDQPKARITSHPFHPSGSPHVAL